MGRLICVYAKCITLVPGADPEDGVKPKGVIHWVSAEHSVPATIRQYDRLFSVADPARADDMMSALNPDSLVVSDDAMIEPALRDAAPEQVFQFEREGYFVADRYDHSAAHPVFNMTIGLRDSWSGSNG